MRVFAVDGTTLQQPTAKLPTDRVNMYDVLCARDASTKSVIVCALLFIYCSCVYPVYSDTCVYALF